MLAPAWGQGARSDQPPPEARRRRRQAQPKAPQRNSSMPKTPAEREKMLSDLYAHLATSDDEEAAKAVAEAIERVWLNSGSDTIDLLMERSMKAMRDKKNDLALKLLDHVVALAPDFTEGWNRRAYVHYMKKRGRAGAGRPAPHAGARSQPLQGARRPCPDPARDRPEEPALKAFKQLLDMHPYWSGAQDAVDELEREVEGQGI